MISNLIFWCRWTTLCLLSNTLKALYINSLVVLHFAVYSQSTVVGVLHLLSEYVLNFTKKDAPCIAKGHLFVKLCCFQIIMLYIIGTPYFKSRTCIFSQPFTNNKAVKFKQFLLQLWITFNRYSKIPANEMIKKVI